MTTKEKIIYDMSDGRKEWFKTVKQISTFCGYEEHTTRRKLEAFGVEVVPGTKKYYVRDVVDAFWRQK